ncbi:chorismate-binding protein [Halocola ammonii]
MELLPAVDIALAKNFAFAAYRLPARDQFQFILQNGDELKKPSERCFVFHPFEASTKHPSIYLQADHVCSERSFSHSEKLADKLQLQAGFARPQEIDLKSTSKETHLNRVKDAIKRIERGDFEKSVVARIEKVDRGDASISKLLDALANRYPSAFVCVFNHPKAGTWICATPETLVKGKENRFETMSLAGTKPSKSEPRDWTEKERQEQKIVTQDILNQLEKLGVSKLKSSRVETVNAGNVMHLKSTIRFESDKSILEIAMALHPTPAVNGFPRKPAMKFICEHEKEERKYYSGFLGPIGLHKVDHLFVNLRCMEVFPNNFVLHIGGGITADSDPQSEWEETAHKAATLQSVIEKFRT